MRRADFWIFWTFLNKGCLGVGEPNGSCIHEKGSNKGHIGDKYGFLLLPPVSTSKDLEDADTGYSPADYRFDMAIEFEVRVESHSQYAWCLFKR